MKLFKYRKIDQLNLPFDELKDGIKREKNYQWSDTYLCESCGDRMFYNPKLGRWFCRSWLYMEGGC